LKIKNQEVSRKLQENMWTKQIIQAIQDVTDCLPADIEYGNALELFEAKIFSIIYYVE